MSSVKDSVKKFSVAGAAASEGSSTTRTTTVRPRAGNKPEGARSEEGKQAAESSRASSARGEKPQPSEWCSNECVAQPLILPSLFIGGKKPTFAKKTEEPVKKPVAKKPPPIKKVVVQSEPAAETMEEPTSPSRSYNIPVRKAIHSEVITAYILCLMYCGHCYCC